LPVDLKTLTPDTTVPSTAVLFGADSQAATDPSVYPLPAVRDGVNVGDVILTDAPFISWNVETSRIASVTLGGNRTLLSPTNHKDGGEYKLLVFQDGTGGRTLAYDSNIVWPGGTAPNLSGAAANSLIVITLVSDGVRLYATADQTYTGNSPTLYHNFASGALPSWLTFSRAGHATMIDSSGNITWAPNNMLLNSATLSTQSVATAGGHSNILSFRGTGSVTLSGSATGTLAGTGVNNRVSLVIAPTAGSLTLTVTGQVLDAQLERVTYETAPRTYNPTTGVAFFGPRFDWTGGTPGLLIEEARTNLLQRSEEIDVSPWGGQGILAFGSGSVANAVISPDGRITAERLMEDTATSPHRYWQGLGSFVSGTTYSFSIYVKRGSGTRNVSIAVGPDTSFVWASVNLGTGAFINPATSVGGATGAFASVTQIGSYYRIVVSGAPAVTSVGWVYINIDNRTAPGGGAAHTYLGDGTSSLDVWGAQLEVGHAASSYIPTFGSAVTRAVDVAQFNGPAVTALRSAEASAIVETRGGVAGDSNVFARIIGTQNANNPIGLSGGAQSFAFDGTTVLSSATGISWRTNTTRSGGAWTNSSTRSVVYNGGTVATGALATTFASSDFYLGGFGATGSSNVNGRIGSVALWNSRLPDAVLQAKSVVGANY
jgi:hypothetical protein